MKKLLKFSAAFCGIMLCCICFLSKPIESKANVYGQWQDTDGDGYSEVRCTWFAWEQAYNNTGVQLPGFGNAKNWLSAAQSAGYSTGNTACANSIAVWDGGTYGHVTYVKSVNGTTMVVDEGGRTDLDHTSSAGVAYNQSAPATVGSDRWGLKLIGFIYLTGAHNNPQGVVETIAGSVGSITVSGWVFDRDSVETPVELHVYIGGPAGSDAEVHIIKANKERPDVNTAYPGVGNQHGFSETISTNKSGNQEVYIYAIDVDGGSTNPELGHKTITITPVYVPEGYVDSIVVEQGSVKISGWAFDRDSAETALSIHVYIGGVFQGGMKANKTRTDVNAAYPGAGEYHGFNGIISTTLTGKQKIEIYAINVGGGSGNVLIGEKTITIYKDDCTNPAGHTYSTIPVITKATLTTDGAMVYICSHCNKSKSSVIPHPRDVHLSATTFQYDGMVHKPDITVWGRDGKEIEVSNYNITYSDTSSCDIGIYSIMLIFKGDLYSGELTKTYQIVFKEEIAELPEDKDLSDSQQETISQKETIIKPNRVGKVKVKSVKKKNVLISWKKLSNANGYQVQYATDNKFKNKKNKYTKQKACTIKKLKKKKIYYFRVRAYKMDGKKKVYGKWSKVKKIKIRK